MKNQNSHVISVYCKWMKTNLKRHNSNDIFFATEIVCLNNYMIRWFLAIYFYILETFMTVGENEDTIALNLIVELRNS